MQYMKVEILIYCYGAICLSMIVFNFLCIVAFKNREARALRQSRRFMKRIEKQMEAIRQGESLSEKDYKFLTKKLKTVGNLMAFDQSLEELYAADEAALELYIGSLHRVFFYLASVYLKKEDMESAFFLHFINKYRVSHILKFDALIGVIMAYFEKPSVYCSLNAMDALYISGQSENVLSGLKILNRKSTHFHTKLIVKGLCSFTGNTDRLIADLKVQFSFFSTVFQTAILDYFATLHEPGCDLFAYEHLINEQEDPEIRYSCIRYFGRNHYTSAYPVLLELAREKDTAHWIYTSQAVTSLAGYPGEETVRVLKDALSNANWYVRYNAAISLEKLDVTYNELSEIINGNDRYAREMVTYRAEHKSLEGKQVVLA